MDTERINAVLTKAIVGMQEREIEGMSGSFGMSESKDKTYSLNDLDDFATKVAFKSFSDPVAAQVIGTNVAGMFVSSWDGEDPVFSKEDLNEAGKYAKKFAAEASRLEKKGRESLNSFSEDDLLKFLAKQKKASARKIASYMKSRKG